MIASTSLDRVSLMGRLLRRMNLRFPTLFLLFAVLTVLDLLIPDFIPFVDEFGLALITFILGLWGIVGKYRPIQTPSQGPSGSLTIAVI